VQLPADEFLHRLSQVDDPFDGEALVMVDGWLPAEAGRQLGGVPAVVVGWAGPEATTVPDVLVTDEAEIEHIERVVAEHPAAAVALAVLLRESTARTIGDGLAAESATYSMLQAGADHRRWLGERRPPRPGSRQVPSVLMERTGNMLHVTLARGDRRNAYSAAMRDGLVDALNLAIADPSVRVVLDGAGPSFCSGGDLDEFGLATDVAGAHVLRLRRSAARAIASIADRVSVHVHGACVGAGVELPAFAGHVIAARGTRFWLPEVSMGLVPGAGGTVSLPRRIGRQRTAHLALTGQPIDDGMAMEWGLVDEVVE
jgi:hypothetical protein